MAFATDTDLAGSALLPIADARCQKLWQTEILAVYERQGLGDFIPSRYALEPEHIEDLAKSGISQEQAAAAGIVSIGPLYLERLGIHSKESLLAFLYLDPWGTPYTWVDRDGNEIPFIRVKLNKPRSGQKYSQAPGSGIYPYFPQVARGQVEGWSTWGVAANTDETLQETSPYPHCDALLTEGEKKALKGTLEGFPTIGLGGVWNFKGAFGGVHGDLFLVANRLRSLTILYDNDCSHKPQVAAAANAILKELVEHKSSAHQDKEEATGLLKGIKRRIERGEPCTPRPHISTYLYWSLLPHTLHGEKIGLDDLLIKPCGKDILDRLIDARLPGIHSAEEGTAKKGDLKVSYHPTYTHEPCGDSAWCKVLPQHSQQHLRRVLTESAMMLSYVVPVQGSYPYQWDAHKGIWEAMAREDWESFPLQIADRHHWKNRTGSLMATCAAELLKHSQPFTGFNPRLLVGFANGDYNPVTGTLHPITPGHYLTSRIAVDWVPGAGCRRFLSWLNWMWGDSLAHQIELFRAALRWTFEPKRADRKFGAYENSVEAIFGIVGPAGRGKGSLLELLIHMLGETSHRPFSLSDAANPNSLSQLIGTQAAIDSDQKGRLTEYTLGALNKLASNEHIEVKVLYKDVRHARISTVLWFAANRLPQTSSHVEDNEGWGRRFIPFLCEKKPLRRDPGFLDAILRELPGIVQWVWDMPISEAVNVLRDFQERGPDEQTIQASLECHTIYLWLQDLLSTISEKDIEDSHVTDTVRVSLVDEQVPVIKGEIVCRNFKQLHNSYLHWCDLNRERHPFGNVRFNELMGMIGAKSLRTNRSRAVLVPIAKLDYDCLVTGG